MAVTSSTKQTRPGGRSARNRRSVLDATLALLLNNGGEELSMEGVARRAGVNRSTLYRRWGDLGALIRETLAEIEDAQVPMPDTGSLQGDLLALARGYAHHFQQPEGQAINRLIAARRAQDPRLGQWMDEYWLSRRQHYLALLQRAVDRGELSDTDGYVYVFELVIGPLLLRALFTHQAIDEGFIRRLAETAHLSLTTQKPL